MGESACEAGLCDHCADHSVEVLCDERLRLSARVAELESAMTEIRKLLASDALGILDRIELEVQRAMPSNSEGDHG